jgi:rhodanese-related sulfurtransferase
MPTSATPDARRLSVDRICSRQALIAFALLASAMFLPRFVSRLRRPAVGRTDAMSLRQRVDGGAPPVILDVRSAEEYEGELGHIAGALNIPLGELASHLPQVAPSGEAGIVVVRKTDRRSTTAAEMLINARLGSVDVMAGGMKAWHRLGYPVERAFRPREHREAS